MDPTLLCLYRLGIRLAQARLLHEHAIRFASARGPDQSVDHGLTRLAVAFDSLSRTMPLDALKQHGEEIVRQAVEEWNSLSPVWREYFDTSTVGSRIEQLESLIREFLKSSGKGSLQLEGWFRLGLEIVLVSDYQKYPRPLPAGHESQPGRTQARPSVKPDWQWDHPEQLEELLRLLSQSREQFFVELQDDAPNEPSLPRLPAAFYSWYAVEEGLRRLSTIGQPPAGSPRRCFDRDHQFLEWYETVGTETLNFP